MAAEQVSTLPTGERLITERLGHVRSVSLGFWIPTGSRDERGSQAGMSHFLEHLLFKGTRSFSAAEIAERFDAIGGELNALTTKEYTLVYARVMDEHLADALDVMVEMVYEPTLDDLDSEREVVLEEIAMVEDTPSDLVHDLLGGAIFAAHELGRPIIGDADVIRSVTGRSLRSYHSRCYRPDRIVVAAAGNLRHAAIEGLLADRLPGAADAPVAPARRFVRRRARPTFAFRRKDTEQFHLCLGATWLARDDERRFAGSVLDNILGGSASSRLFQEIREKRGLAYSVYTFASLYEETGEVGVYVGTRDENVEECLRIVDREIEAVAAGSVSAVELRRAKENLKGRIMLSLESVSNRASRLGKALVTGVDLLTPAEIIELVESVDVQTVAGLAAEMLAPERRALAAIGSSESVARRAAAIVNPALEERAAA